MNCLGISFTVRRERKIGLRWLTLGLAIAAALAPAPTAAQEPSFAPPGTQIPYTAPGPPLPNNRLPGVGDPYLGSPNPPPVLNSFHSETYTGGWLVGAGVLYLTPRWGSNPAYSSMVTANTGPVTTVQTTTQNDLSMNGKFAPLLWLGYVNDNGIGMRARWSHFQGSTETSVSNPAHDDSVTTTIYSAYPLGVGFAANSDPAINNNLTFDSGLTLDVTDLELLWDIRGPVGSLLLGAGVRYAHISQNYDGTWAAVPTDPTQDTITTALMSAHSFDGFGPVVSAEGRYPLGSSGVALLGSLRGALLLGTGSQWANLTTTEVDPTGNLVSQSSLGQSRSIGGAVPVMEFELGAEWGQQFGAYRLTLQTAFVGQAWFDVGNASGQQTVLGSTFPDNGLANFDTLALLGLRLTLALSY
jgi:hypothetical protein